MKHRGKPHTQHWEREGESRRPREKAPKASRKRFGRGEK